MDNGRLSFLIPLLVTTAGVLGLIAAYDNRGLWLNLLAGLLLITLLVLVYLTSKGMGWLRGGPRS